MASREDVVNETTTELVAWGLDIEEGLTDWETSFLESLQDQLRDGRDISTRQRTKLEQIIQAKG